MMATMLRVLALLALVLGVSSVGPSDADAAPKKKYHFKLAAVTAKPEVAADVAEQATPRLDAMIKKTFATHSQLVASLDGAPDPQGQPHQFRKFLAKKGVDAAYLVTVELTDAEIEIEPMESKPNSQRIVVRVGLHLLGENIPGQTIGFTGDGSATIKLEVGKKIRDRDREYAWDSATEAAIAEALKTVFDQLAKPRKKQ
jgi:hypothetical protein